MATAALLDAVMPPMVDASFVTIKLLQTEEQIRAECKTKGIQCPVTVSGRNKYDVYVIVPNAICIRPDCKAPLGYKGDMGTVAWLTDAECKAKTFGAYAQVCMACSEKGYKVSTLDDEQQSFLFCVLKSTVFPRRYVYGPRT